MLSDTLAELSRAKQRVVELEELISKERAEQLAGLPQQYGFTSVDEFTKAVRNAAGRRRGRPPGTRVKGTSAKVTDTTRSLVTRFVNEGKTGREIASELGISISTVNSIKKALGITKRRNKG